MPDKINPIRLMKCQKDTPWQQAVDTLPIPIIKIALDSNYSILSANKAFFMFIDKTKGDLEETENFSLLSFLHPEDISGFIEVMQNSFKDHEIVTMEYRILTSEGTIAWVHMQCQYPSQTDGVAICCLTDITKWKEREIFSNEEILTLLPGSLVDSSNDIYHYITYNDVLILITGYSYADYIKLDKKQRYRIIYPDDQLIFSEIIYKLKKGIPFQMNYRIYCKDGTMKKLYAVGERYKNKTNSHYYQCIITDTTSYKNAQIIFDLHKNGSLYRAYGRTTAALNIISSSSQSERDPLTGLYSYKAAKLLMDNSLRFEPDYYHIILIVALHHLEKIRETDGFMNADNILLHATEILNANFRKSDIIGRMGRNQFVILMRDIPGHVFSPLEKSRQLKNALKINYKNGSKTITISADIGIAVYPTEGTDLNELLNQALQSLKHANALHHKRQLCKK